MSVTLRGADPTQPPYDYPAYRSTIKRHPKQPLIAAPRELIEVPGVACEGGWAGPDVVDLTRQHAGEPLGERIIVAGRVLDEDGRAVRRSLVELWQANAAGRYAHDADQHAAPLDPNFRGAGQTLTDDDGAYRFVTIKPGAYPWRNSYNAWRPAHIHVSLFGSRNDSRLVTQMYFPGDPLLEYDPVIHSIADAAARARLVSAYDPALSEEEWALGYRFDIVLRGRSATPLEPR
ncbi:MAG: pcaH [Candidatus Eremiobacteraeota bacterium]|nr:pcaH [Candidatus Eremiobacteraeota bacterium]